MHQITLCLALCILTQIISAQSPRHYQFCEIVDCPVPECEAGAIPVELPKHRFECCTRFECMPCSSDTCGYQCMGQCPECHFGQYCNLQSCQCVCNDGNVPSECSSSRCHSAASPKCFNYPNAICSSDGCNECATVFLDEMENVVDCGEIDPENPYFQRRRRPQYRGGGGYRPRSRPRPYYPPRPPPPRYNYGGGFDEYSEYDDEYDGYDDEYDGYDDEYDGYDDESNEYDDSGGGYEETPVEGIPYEEEAPVTSGK